MKSNSDVIPLAIQPLGNGAYHYNYNITERTEEVEPQASGDENPEGADIIDTTPTTRTTYDCETVLVWGNPNYKNLTRAVIRSEVSETEEFGLINDYNAARAGLLDDDEAEKAEEAYTAHLRRVAEIKAMVKEDLAGAGF